MCFLWVLKNSEQSFLRQWWNDLPMNRLGRILEVLYLGVSNFEYKVGAGRTWCLSSLVSVSVSVCE